MKNIHVDYSSNARAFSIKNMDTGEISTIRESELIGNNSFKYYSDFEYRFLKEFPGSKLVSYSPDAKKKILEIRDFNRIDT